MNTAEIAFWVAAAMLGYTHAVYPGVMVVLAAVGRRAASRRADSVETPHVSLIIPAFNEESVLRDKLENALAIEYPRDRLEIIVASDGSLDGTVSIARGFEDRGVRVLAFPKQRGKASVINDAAAEALGDVLCFCDANVMFRPDALRRMVARLDQRQVGAVSGDVRLESSISNFGAGERLFYWIERAVQAGESLIGSMMGVDGGMYLVRRELFDPIPADTILDDFVVSMQVMRRGKRVLFEPTAIATENGTPLARQEFRRRVRVSAGAVQSLKRGQWPRFTHAVEFWQYISHKLLRWLGHLWLAILLVTNALLFQSATVYQIAMAGQLGLYALAIMGTLVIPFRRTTLGGIPFYFAMSYVAMVIGFVKGLLDRQNVIWGRTERTIVSGLEGHCELRTRP